jgi:hypothetical protein
MLSGILKVHNISGRMLLQIIELLSIHPPPIEAKLKLLKEIAEEHEVDWDPSETETEFLKHHEDLLVSIYLQETMAMISSLIRLSLTQISSFLEWTDLLQWFHAASSQGET